MSTNSHIKGISFVVNLLHLKELYLEHCINIDDAVATSVLSCDAHLQALETLSLRMCEQFDSEELIAIALSHPSLRIYKIDGCCNVDVLSYYVRILNFPRMSLSEFDMTPDLDCHTIEEWNYLENMFGELRLLNELIVTLVAKRTKKCEALQNTQESVTFTCYFFIVDYLILCIQSCCC